MKTKLFLALLLAGLLAVIIIPTGVVLAAPHAPDADYGTLDQPVPDSLAITQQPPVVQVVIGLMAILFGCLAFAPLVTSERVTPFDQP